MRNNILVVSNKTDSAWLHTVAKAAHVLGQVQIVAEKAALAQLSAQGYDLIVLDAAETTTDVATLVTQLRDAHPNVPIIVATTSPNWQRARQAFRAGASDYVRKSLDVSRTTESLKDLLDQ
jgi:DNA-binding NtrC family response regulator